MIMNQPTPRNFFIKDLDLSEKENIVLETLIQLKMGRNVTKIAREAGLPRTTVAFTLKKLENRKLAHRELINKRYYWTFRRVATKPS